MSEDHNHTGDTGDSGDSAEGAQAAPVLRVITPDATPEEIAAIVAVVAALGAGAPAPRRRRPQWGAPHRQVRRTLPHGPGGWRSSALPR